MTSFSQKLKNNVEEPALPRDQVSEILRSNPACIPWTGPYGGVPPFDRVSVEDLAPALRAGMEEQLAEVAVITSCTEPATFENTILAFERSGEALRRSQRIFGTLCSLMSNDVLRAVEKEMVPLLCRHSDRLFQNENLFSRIDTLYQARETAGLSPEQMRLLTLCYRHFERSGAKLKTADKAELSRINHKLGSLYTHFSQNVLRAESEAIFLDNEADLDGLPSTLKDAMAQAATDLGKPGAFALVNTRSIVEPLLTHSSNRALRKRVFELFMHRGDGGANDNNSLIPEILQLRDQRAKLLGYPTHAHLQLDETMARAPEQALQLLRKVLGPAVGRIRQELDEIREVAQEEGLADSIEPWDVRYYQEKVRVARYSLHESEIMPYLQVERLRDGMFFTASKLFQLSFLPVPPGSVPTYHPDVEVWEVRDRLGEHLGLFYFDPYWHEGKRSGAWMSGYRAQHRLDGSVTPLITNHSNFMKGIAGQPTLLTWADATTLFHEFGHALHGLCSNVTYPSLSGASVPSDFVELPSQLLEHWLETPEVLSTFALHYKTNEPIPLELIEKIRRAQNFNTGFLTTEYLTCAIVDMELHLAGNTPINTAAFERKMLEDLGLPREVVMRHRMTHFLHIFAGDGYSAGYYSYLWADVLAADAWEAFLEAGSPWDQEVAKRLHAHILSTGNIREPFDSYRAFRGRDADSSALMRERGFA